MDLNKHFQTYRASLGKDALEGCVEYTKSVPTAQPEIYPTVYDYLHVALNNVRESVFKNNESEYRLWIGRHQTGMVAIFERMVRAALPETLTKHAILDLIRDKGWNWFKFNPASVTIDLNLGKTAPEMVTLCWVPRYSKKFSEHWNTSSAVPFDADELEQFWILMDDETTPQRLTQPAIEFKKRNPGQKLISLSTREGTNIGLYKPIGLVNSDNTVVDWTLPLF